MVDTKWLMAIGVVGLAMATVVGSARASSQFGSEAEALGGKDGGAMELGGKDGGAAFAKDGGAFELAHKDGGSVEFAKDGGGALFAKDGGAFELATDR